MLGSKAGFWPWLAGVLLWTSAVVAQDLNTITIQEEEYRPLRARFSGDWSLDIGGGSYQHGKDSFEGAYTYLSTNFNFQFLKQFKARISPMARFSSGRVQDRFDAERKNFVFLSEGWFSYKPVDQVDLRFGIHSQRIVGVRMLVSSMAAFPGFQEIVTVPLNEEIKGRLIAQQVIPVSSSDNLEREKAEPTPWFFTTQAELLGKTNGLEWKAFAGAFEWKDIPAKTVFESRQVGNVGAGDVAPGSRYLYGHRGYFGGGNMDYDFTKQLGVFTEYKRLRNIDAPSDSADGQLWAAGPKFRFQDKTLKLGYSNYFIESNATVAVYSRSRYGNTNRIGEILTAELHFEKLGFKVYGEYYRNKPINIDPNQFDMEQVYIGMETDSASF